MADNYCQDLPVIKSITLNNIECNMPVNFFQRRKILKGANYLDLVPYRIFKEEVDDNGIVTVLVPKFRNWILVKVLVPRLKSKYFKIKLDELGSRTWLSIDGKNNVASLAQQMKEIFGEKIDPVYDRLTTFITRLYLEGYISFNQLKKEGE